MLLLGEAEIEPGPHFLFPLRQYCRRHKEGLLLIFKLDRVASAKPTGVNEDSENITNSILQPKDFTIQLHIRAHGQLFHTKLHEQVQLKDTFLQQEIFS